MTREPGDLPSVVVTREHIGRGRPGGDRSTAFRAMRQSAFAVTCHVTASRFMSSSSSVARNWRLGLVCSLSSLLLPAEASAQTASTAPRSIRSRSRPSASAKPKPAARSSNTAAARQRARPATARWQPRRAARAAASGASGPASPTLNATTPRRHRQPPQPDAAADAGQRRDHHRADHRRTRPA